LLLAPGVDDTSNLQTTIRWWRRSVGVLAVVLRRSRSTIAWGSRAIVVVVPRVRFVVGSILLGVVVIGVELMRIPLELLRCEVQVVERLERIVATPDHPITIGGGELGGRDDLKDASTNTVEESMLAEQLELVVGEHRSGVMGVLLSSGVKVLGSVLAEDVGEVPAGVAFAGHASNLHGLVVGRSLALHFVRLQADDVTDVEEVLNLLVIVDVLELLTLGDEGSQETGWSHPRLRRGE
jgi:hypothetical protein